MLNVVIDLSHYNTIRSFKKIKESGILGIIHKVTEGRTVVDAKYRSRRQLVLAEGLMWGAYHFGTKGNVAVQVDHFLDTFRPDKKYLLVLDFEPNGKTNTMTLSDAEDFVTRVRQKTGRYPGLYSGQAFLREKVGGNTATILKECFLWIARYSDQLLVVPPAWKTFTFWQYTDGSKTARSRTRFRASGRATATSSTANWPD
jgi:lysozyme